MNDFDPQLKDAVDNIWLEEVRQEMRDGILRSLERVAVGYFTEAELEVAFQSEDHPYADLCADDDEGYMLAIEQGDEAIERYQAEHPEIERTIRITERAYQAREAACDYLAMADFRHLPINEAVEAVIALRRDELEMRTHFKQGARAAAARLGFAVDPQ
jgi:hypothetical protein